MKVTIGEELSEPLDRIHQILDTVSPVEKQQILEMLLVNHLWRASRKRPLQRFVLDAICKHVWQLLDQVETTP